MGPVGLRAHLAETLGASIVNNNNNVHFTDFNIITVLLSKKFVFYSFSFIL